MKMRRKSALYQGGALYERKDSGAVDFAEVRTAVTGMMSAFEEFKKANDQRLKEIEKKGAADPVTEQKLAKIEADIAKHEGINAKLTAAEQQAKAAKDTTDELRAQLDEIEKKLNRPGGGGRSKEEQKAAFNLWTRGAINAYSMGLQNLPEEQRKCLAAVEAEYKALTIANDTTGGVLAPIEYIREIIRGVTEISPARSIVRVRTTGSKSIMVPKRTGQFAARRTMETGTRTETDGLRFGAVEINAPEAYAMIDISNQNLEDSAFDLEEEIRFEATEQFAVQEGQEVVSGTGVGQCEGYLTNADVAFTVSGTATTIADADGQANGLLTLKHAIKTAYARNATWTLNRTTLGSVRKLKDADKNYIWMPGLAQGKPNTIDGDPYVEMPDMPSEGAGAFPIAYGDFRRGYTLVDRIGMSMLRDPFTQAATGMVRYWFRRRFGGQVVLAEAMRKLKCST